MTQYIVFSSIQLLSLWYDDVREFDTWEAAFETWKLLVKDQPQVPWSIISAPIGRDENNYWLPKGLVRQLSTHEKSRLGEDEGYVRRQRIQRLQNLSQRWLKSDLVLISKVQTIHLRNFTEYWAKSSLSNLTKYRTTAL